MWINIEQGIMSPGYTTCNTSFNISSGYAGTPEIDGSLAPKVGFLLGCLFLMFGRKRGDSLQDLSSRPLEPDMPSSK